MSENLGTLDAPVLVLADLDGTRPTDPALELVAVARTLTGGDGGDGGDV